MATKIKDAAVVTSTYTANGQEKSRWTNVGALYQKDDGSMFLSLNAFFNFSALQRQQGSDRVIIAMFDPKKREDTNNNSNSYSSYGSDTNNSDIPF